jgi:hypothetical protein
VDNEWVENSSSETFSKSGTDGVNGGINMSGSDNKKNAPAGDTGHHRRKRREKMIRLDDLIPKENVVGGCGLLFGAPQSTQTNNPKQQN